MFPLEKGEQVFTNCTIGGPVFVHVKNGRMIRIRPMVLGPGDPKPWVIEARGKRFFPPRKTTLHPCILTERARVYSPERILNPLKRMDFDPEGEKNPENRGKSGYEKTSWEEALDIVAKEIKRLKGRYGPSTIMATASSHHMWGNIGYRHSALQRFFNLLGCTWIDHNPDSWEGWHWGAMHTWGFAWRLGQAAHYDLLEDALRHCEMIVFWSSDPSASYGTYAGQESERWRLWLRDLGIKMVFIDPYCNHTAVKYADKWLAPRPGTDTALALAIAYVWIAEDGFDKEYLKTHTYGFDQWRRYVLGEEDGVPKEPNWAEEIAGVKARNIIALAREWASKRTMLAAGGRVGLGGACRAAYGHEWSRMMVLLQAMQGLGKPGVNMWATTTGAPCNWDFYFPGYAEGGISGDAAGWKYLVPRGMVKIVTRGSVRQHINRLLIPDCIVNPPQEWMGEGACGEAIEQQFIRHRYPAPGFSEVRMFYRYGGAYISTMTETNRWVRMYRSPKLEFVVNQSPWMEPETRFADIILPACTNFERWDIGECASTSGYTLHTAPCNYRIIVLQMKCIEPLGESKSDYEIFALLADRLGFKEEYTEGMTGVNWVKRMFEVTDLPNYISWEDFKKKGYFVVPLPKDYKPTPFLRWFYENRPRDTPDWGPSPRDRSAQRLGLATTTGKIEFVSKSLTRFDPNDEERPPLPHYIPSWEGHTSELTEKYPLQLISPHPRFSFHTQYDGKMTWVEEIKTHRRYKDGRYWWIIRIHMNDAEARGIRDGDIVKVYNARGSVLCTATITERIRPGVVHSYCSSGKYDPLGEADYTDRGGCINFLTPSRFLSKNASGMAPNSCLVEIDKWRGG